MLRQDDLDAFQNDLVGGPFQSLCLGDQLSVEPVVVNGSPAFIMRLGGEIDSVMAVRVEGGRVAGLYNVRNPEKLSRIERATTLTR